VTGVEGASASFSSHEDELNTLFEFPGVFRKASEITMQILRVHKDSLMNVLEAYVHDPLVEWEDERMKRVRFTRIIDNHW
jgi:phosphatidylinositol kinase/protein kinase (PI-3  family)